jgi:hypothetical protein
MKTLTYTALVLAVIAGAAPAMAQFVQPAAPDAAIAVQAQPPLNAQELGPVGGSATDMRGQPRRDVRCIRAAEPGLRDARRRPGFRQLASCSAAN